MDGELQAYIFNRTHYDGVPLSNWGDPPAYQVTVIAESKGAAWTLLLDEDGHGTQSDWGKPEVKPLKPGILHTAYS